MKNLFYLLIFIFSINVFSQDSLKLTKISSINKISEFDIKITDNAFCEYPDICQDEANNFWITYTELTKEGEVIILVQLKDTSIIRTYQISKSCGFEFRPRLYCDKGNKIWIVWAAKRNNNWDIYSRYLSNGKLSAEFRITQNTSVDINPVITGDGNENIFIAWETNRSGNFDIYFTKISDDKIYDEFAITTSDDMELRPSIICNESEIYVSWDKQHLSSYQIMLRIFNGNIWESEKYISSDIGFNMSSSLALNNKNELYISYHSNLQPDKHIGLTPWVYLVKYADEDIVENHVLAESGDWIKNGEEQGFEFPTILFDSDNILWLFGRPSQGFYAQLFSDNKKSEIFKFDVPGWGGRGLYVCPLLGNDGIIYAVRRDINRIYLSKLDIKNYHLDWKQTERLVFDKDIYEEFTYDRPIIDSPTYKMKEDYKVFFGDIHQHSAISDGMGTIDQCYTRSKYVFGYDFASLTDHEWFVGNLIIPSEWEWIKIIGQEFNQDGEFVVIPAFEWTTGRLPKGFGHKNVYFDNWNMPIFSMKIDAKNTKILFDSLRQYDGIAIPHHIGWTGTDWENHDSRIQPIIEIVSAHGAFEYLGNEPITHRGGILGNFIQDGLTKGLHFGFTGSSDGHGLRWHHGICRKENEWTTGLTGLISDELSLSKIYEALKNRQVYATSGTPIIIKFSINNYQMGEEISTNDKPEIRIDVIGTNRIKYVTLIRDNEEILFLGKDRLEGYQVTATFIDELIKPGTHYYYCRVIQEDGEMAWSSPIWIDYRK
ncbi:MAG: hypothetical protein JXA68_09710 [Ignavibacteriales bacterium]|nr:hypothetical protein [Ignavibacteriales bacterium]